MVSSSAREQSSRSAAGIPGWVPDVTRVVEDLRAMNRSTEAGFLAVGEKLMGFLSAARDIRADIGKLAESISGAAGEDACNALTAVLDRSTEMQKRVEEAPRTLGTLRHTADQIQRRFSRFYDVVLSFQVVATLGRIETARLGSAESDLGHLADEVRSCTEQIRRRVENALQAAAGLDQRIDLTIRQISVLDVQQLKALPSLVGAVEESLQAFRLRQQRAQATSASLASEFRSFSEAINGVVTALQFHDITRQQIEHVVESLAPLAGNGDSYSRTSLPSADELAVIELQRRQLLGAAEAFAASVQQVKLELEQIVSRGREMAGVAKKLLGLAEDERGSFFERMERCFAGVLAAVSNSTALNDETTKAAAELQRTIARLQACIHDIRAIASGINQLAINATIEAVHLGAAGEPLSVVAVAMQTLRADAEKRSTEIESSLGALNAAVLSMIPPAEQAPESALRCDNAAVTEELRMRIDELHLSSARSLTCSQQISAAANTLCDDVQLAANGFTVGTLFCQTLDGCCGVLQRIAAEADTHPAGVAGVLQHLTVRYTMQSEREVHESAMAQIKPGTSSDEQYRLAVPVSPGDWGDSVELF